MSSKYDKLVSAMRDFLRAVTQDGNLGENDLHQVLSFVSDVAQVVDQAFSDVLRVFAKYEHISEVDLMMANLPLLASELKGLRSRQYYKDAGDICGQLKTLSYTYTANIAPCIKHLIRADEWREFFWLLDEREGQVVELVNESVGKLQKSLYIYTCFPEFDAYYWVEQGDSMLPSLDTIHNVALESSKQIRSMIAEIKEIKNAILGLSGKPGLLQLANTDRFKLMERVIQVTNDNRVSTEVHAGGDIKGSFFGRDANNVTISVTEKVSASSAPDDIKTLIQSLAQQIDAVKPNVEAIKSVQLENDFETLGKEVATEQPRKEWYKMSLTGLKEAAESIGTIGIPIATTVAQLMKLLVP